MDSGPAPIKSALVRVLSLIVTGASLPVHSHFSSPPHPPGFDRHLILVVDLQVGVDRSAISKLSLLLLLLLPA